MLMELIKHYFFENFGYGRENGYDDCSHIVQPYRFEPYLAMPKLMVLTARSLPMTRINMVSATNT